MNQLKALGWNEQLQKGFAEFGERCEPGRVSFAVRGNYRVLTGEVERRAKLSGKVREGEHPLVGDWVAVDRAVTDGESLIRALIPRNNLLSRGASGERKGAASAMAQQKVAANIDKALIVCGLDQDYNLRRLERYVTLVTRCGAKPIIALNKADLNPNSEEISWEVLGSMPGIPVTVMSATEGDGMEWIRSQIKMGETICLLGSSGAGKSTIINSLIGEERQETKNVSQAVGKGRHTTTHRELFLLKEGGVLIDNPGMREIALTGDTEDLSGAFSDIETLGEGCRFRDCRHKSETGCEVKAAVEDGRLDDGHYQSYLRLQRELFNLKLREDKGSDGAEKQKWRAIKKEIRRMYK